MAPLPRQPCALQTAGPCREARPEPGNARRQHAAQQPRGPSDRLDHAARPGLATCGAAARAATEAFASRRPGTTASGTRCTQHPATPRRQRCEAAAAEPVGRAATATRPGRLNPPAPARRQRSPATSATQGARTTTARRLRTNSAMTTAATRNICPSFGGPCPGPMTPQTTMLNPVESQKLSLQHIAMRGNPGSTPLRCTRHATISPKQLPDDDDDADDDEAMQFLVAVTAILRAGGSRQQRRRARRKFAR